MERDSHLDEITKGNFDHVLDRIDELDTRLKTVETRINKYEDWIDRQTKFAEKMWEEMSSEDKATAEARLKKLGL